MQKHIIFILLIIPLFSISQPTYPWKPSTDSLQCLEHRIPVPEGFFRMEQEEGSFGNWLRHIPLKAGKPNVHLYNGEVKWNQSVHHAVLDIDVGTRDLQQCADAVMRLKAEYHYSRQDFTRIHFNYTSGDKVGFDKWKEGYRPIIQGNNVSWRKKYQPNDSYASFKSYMTNIFSYAGTYSLSRELEAVTHIENIEAGDVFIQGGFPGHAVIVMDVACHPVSGKKVFLLAQSYMPAQDIHILKNPNSPDFSPWFEATEGPLRTPEWPFPAGSLMRFP
ncbi:MAG: DUF4846 domain-containing protein [Bacteroidota bacterium]